MAKRRVKKSAVKKVGKITMFYFSGDVGDFLEALTAELKKPGTAQKLAQALDAATIAVEAQSRSKGEST